MRWAVALALVLGARHSRAEEPAAQDKARLAALLQAGAQAARAHKWQGCIDALTAAAAIEGSRTTWGDLGLCEVEAGRFVDARIHFRRAFDTATPALLETPRYLRYRLASGFALRRVSLVTITTFPPDAFVLMDGRPLGKADGKDFDVEPGTHTFLARREGYQDATETRTMGPGDVPSFYLRLEPKPAPATTAAPHPAPSAAAPKASAAVPAAAPAGPVSSGPALPWYSPALSARGALLVSTAGALLATLGAAGVSIGAELRREELAKGLAPWACNAAGSAPAERCAELHDATALRNSAQGAIVGLGAATAVLGGMFVGSVYLEHLPSRPSVAVLAGERGGGLVVSGAW
jgi:hypothetical protein